MALGACGDSHGLDAATSVGPDSGRNESDAAMDSNGNGRGRDHRRAWAMDETGGPQPYHLAQKTRAVWCDASVIQAPRGLDQSTRARK